MKHVTNFIKGHSDSLGLITRHPVDSLTWYWAISWNRNRPGFRRDFFKFLFEPKVGRKGQWHHRLYLFGIGYFIFSFQDYHRKNHGKKS